MGFGPPKAELVWRKVTKHGKRWFGMGHYVRNEHETCLIAVRGSMPVADKAIRSTFEAVCGEHSRKPDEMYEIIERLYPNARYLELFARRLRPGWTAIGDQLDAA